MSNNKIPQINEMDIFPLYEDLFTDEAKQAIKYKSLNMLYQYNESTGVNIKPYDPFPENGLHAQVIDPDVVDDPKKQLYRTFCKLGIGMEVERQIASAKFFGVTVESIKNLKEAADIISETINELAKNNVIRAHFTKLSAVQLHKAWNDLSPGRVAVYSIVHIYDANFANNYQKFDKYNIEFQEGAMPERLEDINAIRKK